MSRLVLVTGGGGFIGSSVVDGLLRLEGYRVRVLDNFATGRRSNLAHCSSDIELVEGDIRDLETVEVAVNGVWCILHQAALPSVPRSIKAPTTTNDVNVGGTLALLTAARKAGVRRVVMASSSSVYGNEGPLPRTEDQPTRPLSPYAVSKLASEQYCSIFAQLYGMETLCFRYFNVFGPRQDPTSQYSGVIAKFASAALAGEPYTVYGDGHQARDFTYVDNVVHANLLAVQAEELGGEIVNVACGEMVSLLDLAGTIDATLGQSNEIEFAPERIGDVKVSQASIDAAKRLLGYSPQVGFSEGIRRTLEWYQAPSVRAAWQD